MIIIRLILVRKGIPRGFMAVIEKFQVWNLGYCRKKIPDSLRPGLRQYYFIGKLHFLIKTKEFYGEIVSAISHSALWYGEKKASANLHTASSEETSLLKTNEFTRVYRHFCYGYLKTVKNLNIIIKLSHSILGNQVIGMWKHDRGPWMLSLKVITYHYAVSKA